MGSFVRKRNLPVLIRFNGHWEQLQRAFGDKGLLLCKEESLG